MVSSNAAQVTFCDRVHELAAVSLSPWVPEICIPFCQLEVLQHLARTARHTKWTGGATGRVLYGRLRVHGRGYLRPTQGVSSKRPGNAPYDLTPLACPQHSRRSHREVYSVQGGPALGVPDFRIRRSQGCSWGARRAHCQSCYTGTLTATGALWLSYAARWDILTAPPQVCR